MKGHRHLGRTGAVALAVTLSAGCVRPPASPANALRTLDDFESHEAWSATGSDGVLADVAAVPGVSGEALRMSFDFQGHGGHAAVRRPLALELPANYEISFFLRGEGPPNDLQFKLLDESGDNVWWFRQRNLAPSESWRRVSFKKRQLEFAWGPTRERELSEAAGLELVIAAGQGGRGWVAIDDLAIRELPLPPAIPPAPIATASSNGPAAALALDGRLDTAWTSASGAGPEQQLELDLGYEREFGGLILRWAAGAFASKYDVEVSLDRREWRSVRSVTEGNGERDALLLPESEARFVRLRLHQGPGPGYALAELEVKDLAFGATPNAFVSALAHEAPRGRYPRAFLGEQPYWTIVGVDGGSESGLLSEDGALELGRGKVAIEPFVVVGTELVTWADVDVSQSLLDGYLPIPSVLWRRPEWELRITALAAGDDENAQLGARYDVTNRRSTPLELTLLLAVRPLQVNPPTQSLNQAGGFSPISRLDWEGDELSINGELSIRPLLKPASVDLSTFDAADFPERLPKRAGRAPTAAHVLDPTGMASGLLRFPVSVQPGETLTVALSAPLIQRGTAKIPLVSTFDELRRAREAAVASWRDKLDRVTFQVPAEGQALVDTLRTSLAHMLISRDGPVLRPGTRSYARSWIRDGAMMSESLLRLGHATAAEQYFDFYAPHQFASGKVPCCVDARGADPVPEHDSPGEFIFLAAELERMTHDRARLERAWPAVLAAAQYLESLRQQTRIPENREPERRHLYGLLPASISHEGYSDKPAYSYWDDFWALIGYQDAAWLADAVGDRAAREKLVRQRDEFQNELYASLSASATLHKLPFFPGAADRGDFDATSTTIALAPGREAQRLPRELLLGTFERYWDEFGARRSGGKSWDAYTPYEWRVAGTFIRLGWRERAQVLFEYFMADRRPAAWNQWAEVVGRDARQPRFIGDMPHAWISSDYIRSVLDMFAYARDADQALVLAAGVPANWLDGDGVAVRGLRTAYGPLDFSISRAPVAAGSATEGPISGGPISGGPAAATQVIVSVSGVAPPGGCVLPWPWPGAPSETQVTINGNPARWEGGELRIPSMPARVVIDHPRVN
jgi:hypothetical protein